MGTRGHGGECAVGAGCGAAVGWLLRKVQSALITVTVIGGVGAISSLHFGWASPEQVQRLVLWLVQAARAQAYRLLHKADLDDDGELTLEDSKLAASRVAPAVRRHPGLAGGLAAGFLVGYRIG